MTEAELKAAMRKAVEAQDYEAADYFYAQLEAMPKSSTAVAQNNPVNQKSPFIPNAGDYLESALQGATFGWSDEMQAGMKTGFGTLGDYEAERLKIDDRYRQFQDARPGAAIAGEIAGAIATGGVGGAKALGVPALKSASAMTRAGATALLGGVEGGLYGAGTAAPGGRLEDGTTGALVGAVAAPLLGPVANKVGEGVGHIGSILGRKATETPASQSTRVLREFAEEAGLSADDIAQRYKLLGQDGMLMDTDDMMRGAGRALFDMGGEARSTMRGIVDARQLGQVSRLKDATKGAISGDDAIDTIRASIAKRSQESAPLYQSAMTASPSDDMLKLAETRPTLSKALSQGRRIAADMGDPIETTQVLTDGKPSKVYDFKQFHYAKMAIDDEIDRFMRAGESVKARAAITLKNDLLKLMDDASPDYRQAREIFAGESQLIGAVEKGQKFMTMGNREFMDAVDGMGASELEMFRRGAASAILDKMDNTQLTHDAAKKLTNTPAMQAKLSRLFKSPDDAAAFITQIGREAEFTKTRQSLGNSMTSSNLKMQEKLTGSVNNLANFAADAAMGGNPLAGAVRGAAEFFGKKGVKPETISEMTRLLTSKGLTDDQIRQVFSYNGILNYMPSSATLGNATKGSIVPAGNALLGERQ